MKTRSNSDEWVVSPPARSFASRCVSCEGSQQDLDRVFEKVRRAQSMRCGANPTYTSLSSNYHAPLTCCAETYSLQRTLSPTCSRVAPHSSTSGPPSPPNDDRSRGLKSISPPPPPREGDAAEGAARRAPHAAPLRPARRERVHCLAAGRPRQTPPGRVNSPHGRGRASRARRSRRRSAAAPRRCGGEGWGWR